MRPQVTSIAVTLSDGRTLSFDATNLEGIFWADRTVNQMMAPFYDTVSMQLTPADLSGAEAALPILGGQSSVTVTPTLVGNMWNAADASGNLPFCILKSHVCIPLPRY